MKSILLSIWQLPQILLGYVVILVTRSSKVKTYKDAVIYSPERLMFGVSFGPIIILPLPLANNVHLLSHEYGHSIQSKIFGPLYLIVVGLPSITWNILTRIGILDPRKYYLRYPENWADKLGGVRR